MPRRFFGLARNIENGGSVTVIATSLIETGSRMDDYIYEEFKSTGNSEIVLDRELAEARIYPAINIAASGTRKEELLYTADEIARLASLRRWLAGGSSQAAMRGLLKLIDKTPDNSTLLRALNPAYEAPKESAGQSTTREAARAAAEKSKKSTRTGSKKATSSDAAKAPRATPAKSPRARRAKPKNSKE
ncbi:MAG: hypothetical protein R2932_18660 [Caldilineaceae bacterium]